MKNKMTLVAIMYVITLFIAPSLVSAQSKDQSKEYEETLMRILKVSGSTATIDSILPQLIPMIKKMSPSIDEAFLYEFATKWQDKIQKAVIKVYAPIYQEHMTLEELKQVATFYESPIGQKLSGTVPDCMKKTIPLMQQLCSEMIMEIPRENTQMKFKDITIKEENQGENRDKQIFSKAYNAPKDSIELSPIQFYRGMDTSPTLYSIEQRENDTKVTFSAPVYFDRQWFHFGMGFKIFDKQSGDVYNVRGYDGGTPFGRVMFVEGFNNKCIFISLLFPKLKKSVKMIDIIELPHEKDVIPSNNDGKSAAYFNVKVQNYLVSPKKSKKVYK